MDKEICGGLPRICGWTLSEAGLHRLRRNASSYRANKKGYRLIAFIETTKNAWRPIILEKDDQYTPTSAVIRLAPPGTYEGADSDKKVHTSTDGIVSERIEAGVLVYYWSGTRFRSISTSV